MSDITVWWTLTGILVALELATGTFFLLMLALGTAAAALVALANYDLASQLAAAAIVGGLGAAALGQWRRRRLGPREAQDQQLDIGATVQVQSWTDLGTTQVMHRGASWTAELAPGQTAEPGAHRIQSIAGSRLILEKI